MMVRTGEVRLGFGGRSDTRSELTGVDGRQGEVLLFLFVLVLRALFVLRVHNGNVLGGDLGCRR